MEHFRILRVGLITGCRKKPGEELVPEPVNNSDEQQA